MGYCKNCGTKLQEGAVFCPSCGTKNEEQVQGNVIPTYNPSQGADANQQAFGTQPYSANLNNIVGKKPSGKRNGLLPVIAIVAIAVVVVLALVFRTPGYEKPLKNMFQSMEKSDYDKFVACFPEYIQDGLDDMVDSYYDDSDEFMDAIVESLEDEYGDDIKISYKIEDKDKLDNDELNDIEDDIESTYDEKVSIKAGYDLSVEVKMKGSDDKDTSTEDFTVIKIGSKWYLQENPFL